MPAAKLSNGDESSEDEDEDKDEAPATKASAKADKEVPITLNPAMCDY